MRFRPADCHRPFLWGSDRPTAVGCGVGGRRGDRSGTDQGRAVLATVRPQVAGVVLRNPANRNRAVSLTPEEFRYGFANAVSDREATQLYDRWTIPSPGKPLFEAAIANFEPHSPAKVDTRRTDRGPLLVTAGGKDHTVPAAISRATVRLYGRSHAVTDLRQFPDQGHSLTIDSGWRDVAETCLTWLKSHPCKGP